MQRRALLLTVAGTGLSGLSGCGFALRREPELMFRSMALSGFRPDSPLAAELRRQLSRPPRCACWTTRTGPSWYCWCCATCVTNRPSCRPRRARCGNGSCGSASTIRWRTPGGEVILPRTELRMTRDMNYTESVALAKEQEEALLYRAMQSEAVAQVMRRLAAVRLPS
ncbi:LPS-assembly lipoprotein LptE [Roseateles sp. GG27B]